MSGDRAAGFGDAFCLTLITNDPALAAAADRSGCNRVGLDLEQLGKAGRQSGLACRLSRHDRRDLAAVAASLSRAALFVRLNPINPGTEVEVEDVLEGGAAVVMLPFFRSAAEVDRFVRIVDGRARVVLLVETAAAVVRIREVLAVAGVHEVMIGLNDLRLELGVPSHFEVLASPVLDAVAAEVHRAGLALAVGGVARVGDTSLPVPPDLVFAQLPRLGASGAWMSRSFLRGLEAGPAFADAVTALRQRLTYWASVSPAALERARDELAAHARSGEYQPSHAMRKPGPGRTSKPGAGSAGI